MLLKATSLREARAVLPQGGMAIIFSDCQLQFKKLCWPCFFKQLHAKTDIKRLARKGKWYGRLYKTGIDEIPATFTTASDYFTYLFDVDKDLLFKQKQKIRTASIEHYIKKYGEKEGLKQYKKMCARQGYTASTKYFVEEKGMAEEQAKEYHASRATTLENYIKRYGKEDGLLRWNKYCAREAYAGNSLMYYIEKYGEVDGKQKFEEMIAKKMFKMKSYSDVSQELFKMIDEYLGDYSVSSRWELKNHEFELFIQMPGYKYLTKVDYFLNNKIIEFNGTYWHADPRRYKSGDVQHRHKEQILVDDIWNCDKNKQDRLRCLGYDVYVVWEDDYYSDQHATIEKCCKFLKGETM